VHRAGWCYSFIDAREGKKDPNTPTIRGRKEKEECVRVLTPHTPGQNQMKEGEGGKRISLFVAGTYPRGEERETSSPVSSRVFRSKIKGKGKGGEKFAIDSIDIRPRRGLARLSRRPNAQRSWTPGGKGGNCVPGPYGDIGDGVVAEKGSGSFETSSNYTLVSVFASMGKTGEGKKKGEGEAPTDVSARFLLPNATTASERGKEKERGQEYSELPAMF